MLLMVRVLLMLVLVRMLRMLLRVPCRGKRKGNNTPGKLTTTAASTSATAAPASGGSSGAAQGMAILAPADGITSFYAAGTAWVVLHERNSSVRVTKGMVTRGGGLHERNSPVCPSVFGFRFFLLFQKTKKGSYNTETISNIWNQLSLSFFLVGSFKTTTTTTTTTTCSTRLRDG